MEEGRACGGTGTESRQRNSPSLAPLCLSVCPQQLQLCEDEPLSVTVSAPLYIQTPPQSTHEKSLITSHMQKEAKVSFRDVKPETNTEAGVDWQQYTWVRDMENQHTTPEPILCKIHSLY